MEFLAITGRFFESPITALVLCLILGAAAMSGRLSLKMAGLLLSAAAIVAIVGILRSGIKDWRLSLASMCGTVTIACLISYWMRLPKTPDPFPADTHTLTPSNGQDAGVQLSITCNNVALPMAYRGDLWILDTVMFSGMAKMMSPPDKEVLWPEPGVNGFGYVCTVKNYGTRPAYGVMLQVSISVLNIIREGNTWKEGAVGKIHEVALSIPKPLGQQGSDEFSFYVCSYDPNKSLSVNLLSVAFIDSGDPKSKREVPVEVAALGGNPFSVLPKNPFHHVLKSSDTSPSRKPHRR